eukprot:Nk52_evm7s62 gene=Nk52_evmTU7s62
MAFSSRNSGSVAFVAVLVAQMVVLPALVHGRGVNIEEGTYTLTSRNTPHLALSVAGSSKADNGNIIAWQFVKAKSQTWIIRKNGEYYNIINAFSGKALRPFNSGKDSGTNYVQYKYFPYYWSEQFYFQDGGDGYLYVFNRNSQRCLRSPHRYNGGNVLQWEYINRWWSMQWRLTKVSDDASNPSCSGSCPGNQEFNNDCECKCTGGELEGHSPISNSCDCPGSQVPSSDFKKCVEKPTCPSGSELRSDGYCYCLSGQLQNHWPLNGKCDCPSGQKPSHGWDYCIPNDGGTSPGTGTRNHIIHGTGMEEDNPINKWGTDGRGYSIDVQADNGGASEPRMVTSPVRAGKQAILCYIKKAGWGFRSEIIPNGNGYRRYFQTRQDKNYWFAWSMYLPGNWVIDSSGELWAQGHQEKDTDLGEDWRNPPWGFGPLGDRTFIWSRWDDKLITPPSGPNRYGGEYAFEIGSLYDMRGRWTDMVMHINWSHKPNGPGFFRVWVNGKEKVYHKKPNCFNDRAAGPHFKTGIYKWPWNYNQNTEANDRAVYIDEFYIGDSQATYQDVAPRGN